MIDFKSLNKYLIPHLPILLQEHCPGGKMRGVEYVAGEATGGEGESFSMNIKTGISKDFASGSNGFSDIISWYAFCKGLKQIEAAKELAKSIGHRLEEDNLPTIAGVRPTGSWEYHDQTGVPIARVIRYDLPNGKKEFRPQVIENGQFVFKKGGWPTPRQLFRLHEIINNPDKHILLVEGEKTALAGQRLLSGYIATTWPFGVNGVKNTDFSPLKGRKVLLIPDADKPGLCAAEQVIENLRHICDELKVVDVSGHPEGWDIADGNFAKGDDLIAWIKPRLRVIPINKPNAVTNNNLIIAAPDPEQTDVSEPGAKFALWDSIGIPVNAQGNPINNMVTVKRILEYDTLFRDRIWFDPFYDNIFVNGEPLSDTLEINITYMLQEKYGISRMEKLTVSNAIKNISSHNTKNEPLDYLNGLSWDGEDRISTFFNTYYKTVNDEYHRRVALYFWAGMAARIKRPGCRLHCMVILQGPQGRFKSTSLSIIGGKWYATSAQEIGKTEFIRSIKGKLLMEIGELSSFKRSNLEAIKNMLSTERDSQRSIYDKHYRDVPRTCIFAGTTNEDDFLGDYTGARRFFPVTVTGCDVDALERDRDQLFAQAATLTDSDWWDVPTILAIDRQEAHRITDPWEDILANSSRLTAAGINIIHGFQIYELAQKVLNIPSERMDKGMTMRLGACLNKLGFVRSVSKMDGKSVRIWRRDLSERVENAREKVVEFEE